MYNVYYALVDSAGQFTATPTLFLSKPATTIEAHTSINLYIGRCVSGGNKASRRMDLDQKAWQSIPCNRPEYIAVYEFTNNDTTSLTAFMLTPVITEEGV